MDILRTYSSPAGTAKRISTGYNRPRDNHGRIRAHCKKQFPIPRGDSTYAHAKRAEYLEKNLPKAEQLYKRAIQEDDRTESAAKDLAGVLHQQGKTAEAIDFLQNHEALFKDEQTKYQNLLTNLQRQIQPSGNCLNRSLKIVGIKRTLPKNIPSLFKNPSRISDVTLHNDGTDRYALVKFASHSAARKTVDGFNNWEEYSVEWVNNLGEVVGDANFHRLKQAENGFRFSLLTVDPADKTRSVPTDSEISPSLETDRVTEAMDIMTILGTNLYHEIFNPSNLLHAAAVYTPTTA